MIDALKKLFKDAYTPGIIYRTTGVLFSELASFTPKQLSVFDMPDKNYEKNKKISDVMMKIKERYGGNSIHQWIVRKNEKVELGILFEV